MKKIVLILSLCVTYLSIAQEYTPMLADRNEWLLTTCFQGVCGRDVYFTDGDTIVNNTSHKILDGYHYISRTFLLSENINTKQVTLTTVSNNTIKDYLLYDFSLQVGDEFEMVNPITPFPVEGGMFTLTAIKMLPLADGNEYKHFYFSPSPGNQASNWDAIWVEGVGSLAIPTAPGGNPDFNGAGKVSCAFRDGVPFYTDFTVETQCEATLSIATSIIKPPIVQVIYGTENIKLITNNALISNVKMYAATGQIIKTMTPAASNLITFNSNELSKGIYFIEVTLSDGKRQIVKIIVQ